MALNLEAVGQRFDVGERTWDSTDAIIYALGVGAGSQDPSAELEFTTENSEGVQQKALPTFPVVLWSREKPVSLGDFHLSKVLHAEQSLTLHQTIPVAGTARTTSTIRAFYDKGPHALAVVDSELTDTCGGQLLATISKTVFIRGEGGFGGERGSSAAWELPDRPADRTVSYPTRADQALLYRLSGDRNPLHSDPSFAKRAGFDQPILHGLCSYGVTGRALLHAMCDGDPAAFGSMSVRYTKTVLPGEELTVEMWETDEGCRFRTRVGDRLVLDRGEFTRRAS
ncbi:MaoC/PaaZ C-terminal domain-containing protein [Streptomyces sp. NPDC050145]|uniref:MaoC family dehydratase n=1 Tax=Streptomyces sp. NPDC050145 TaxID=3365602 RepID=UPI00379CC6EE